MTLTLQRKALALASLADLVLGMQKIPLCTPLKNNTFKICLTHFFPTKLCNIISCWMNSDSQRQTDQPSFRLVSCLCSCMQYENLWARAIHCSPEFWYSRLIFAGKMLPRRLHFPSINQERSKKTRNFGAFREIFRWSTYAREGALWSPNRNSFLLSPPLRQTILIHTAAFKL